MVRLVRPFVVALLALWLAVQAVPARADSEIARFPVTDFMGETIMLSARLMRPDGDGPFPAVVLLHGCSGMIYDDPWAENHLLPWGYALLEVDSLGPRGIVSVCGNDWLEASPFVRPPAAMV